MHPCAQNAPGVGHRPGATVKFMTPQEIENLAHLRRARDLIDREYAKPLDVPTMAAKALMSPAHFSRQFRAAYGETPYSYLDDAPDRAGDGAAADRHERHRRLHGRRLYLARLVQLAVRRDRGDDAVRVPRARARAVKAMPACVAKTQTRPSRDASSRIEEVRETTAA